MLRILPRFVAVSALIALLTSASPLQNASIYFGPTANLLQNVTSGPPSFPMSISQLLGLVNSTAGQASWSGVRSAVVASRGALHMRNDIVAQMSFSEQASLAHHALQLNLSVSVEAGGAMCGAGSGGALGHKLVSNVLTAMLAQGVTLSTLLIESVFSRTHAGCPAQAHGVTIAEVTDFVAVIAAAAPATRFFLYDALPHFSVGAWPANLPAYGLELGAILAGLQREMASRGIELRGYWMDCPLEYSRDYPNATSPLPAGDGYKKIAAAVALVHSLGMEAAKTFNSQAGGTASDKLFYEGTLLDQKYTLDALVQASAVLDHWMVETWYPFPRHAAPENAPYTTAFTLAAAIQAAGLAEAL